jgi:serine/threonine-protein kinase PknG
MSACSRAGCPGQIEDGYCDVCGLAAAPAPASASASAASRPASQSGPATSGGTRSARSTRTGSTRASRRGMLGAGLVEVPPVPYRDPSAAVVANPEVPERKRFCSQCGKPVGRARNGQPGLAEGFCSNCGARFSFTPKLIRGDLVAGQYEVLGCLAHGGLGWIYLATDRNVSNRWVVLKGLLDSGDADAMAAALAERQFLARVEHPNIVQIYNFVQHPEPGTQRMVGYIVMEYVGGESLRDMMLARRGPDGAAEPIPLGQAIAYALESLRALGYLHNLGLLYCDFKPDNVIQSEEQLKLIDLGGVRRMDDDSSPIYGTVGYQAPEIASDGPSIGSDLYTVARTLAVLTFDFKGYTGTYATSLPDRAAVPLLARHESYDRLLRLATDPDPGRRFDSAAQMAEQLTGVLREVLSAEDGAPRPAVSGVFAPEVRPAGADIVADLLDHPGRPSPPGPAAAAAALGVPLVDAADPAAGYLAGLGAASPADVTVLLAQPPVRSAEVSLRLARARIELGDFDQAAAVLDEVAAQAGGDWRVDWYRALADLARGRDARDGFDAIYSLLPGEAAPKLGLALAAELGGDLAAAARYYELVWTTDQSYVTAAFGLARVRLAAGDRAAAVRALDSVPATSIYYTQAQVAAITARVSGRPDRDLDPADVLEAGSRLEALGLDAERRERLEAEVLEAALASLRPRPGSPARPALPAGRILGLDLTERQLRIGLERTYRALAHLADRRDDRITLVDRANAVRPRTLL